MAKKFLSIVLTLSMVASLFAGMTFNVSAAIKTHATENLEGVTVSHYGDTNHKPNATTAADAKLSVTEGAELVNGTTYLDQSNYNFGAITRDESTGVVTEEEWDKEKKGILTRMQGAVNDPYNYTGDFRFSFKDPADATLVHGRDDGGYYTIDASAVKTYRSVGNDDNNFIRKAYFEYEIGKGATITDIIVGSASAEYRTGYYTVLTSDNGKDWTRQYAYACDREVDGTAVNSAVQLIKFAAP